MGLPLKMSNLHAPTVPSGPTSARAANGGAEHLSFAELQRRKENMEEELKALSGVLDSVCPHDCPGISAADVCVPCSMALT
jgi:26S proteasome non-ATPase regulatory subunit 9